jgi:hypothetical protein
MSTVLRVVNCRSWTDIHLATYLKFTVLDSLPSDECPEKEDAVGLDYNKA